MIRIKVGPKSDLRLAESLEGLMGLEEDPGLIYGLEADAYDLDGPISDEESRGLLELVTSLKSVKSTDSESSLMRLPLLEGALEGVDFTELSKPKDLFADAPKIGEELIEACLEYAASAGRAPENESDYGGLKKDEITNVMLEVLLSNVRLRVDDRGDIHEYGGAHGTFEKLQKYAIQRMVRKVLGPSAEPFMTKSRLADLEVLLKTHPSLYIPDEKFKPPVDMVNVKNGVLNLDTGELLPHSADYRFSIVLNGRYLRRPQDGRKFMKLIRFLCENDPEKIKLLQWYMGYVLSNGNQCKKLLIIVGPPNCGKSVLLEIIRAILGPERVANVQLHLLEKRFVTGHLADKAADIVTEMSVEPITNITTLKLLTSEDAISGEMKGKDRFSYTSRIKFLVASNHLPKLSGNGIEDAFHDRVIILQTKASVDPADRDPNLKEDILRDERDFVLTWCLQGLMALRDNRYVFEIPESSLAIQRKLKSLVNSEKEFVQSTLLFSENREDRVQSHTLVERYATYCKDNCLDMRPKEELFEAISKLGCVKSKFRMPGEHKRVSPKYGFRHMVIAQEDEPGLETLQEIQP